MDDRTLARFMSSVSVQPNSCWHWTGKPNDGGYGRFSIDGRRYRAHRVSYQHFTGPIPDGMEIDHLCHNRDLSCAGGGSCIHRRCVNPEHLEATTHRINMLRGHTVAAANALKTRCPQGHELTPENTYWHDGTRHCRSCRSEQIKAWNASIVWNGPRNAVKTHCKHGHPFDEANTYWGRGASGMQRACRACRRERASRRREQHRRLTA
jgi:hypothetical protein